MEQKKQIKISLRFAIILIVVIVVSILVCGYFGVQYISNKKYINNSTMVALDAEISDTEIADLIDVNPVDFQEFKDDFIGTNVVIEENKTKNNDTGLPAYEDMFGPSNSKKLEFKEQASANFKTLETYILSNEENLTNILLESLENKQLYKYQNRLGVVEKTEGLKISDDTINKFFSYVLSGMIKNYFKFNEYDIKVKEITKNSEVDTDIFVVVNNKYLVLFEYDETECIFVIYNGTEYNSEKEELLFEHIGGYNSLKSWYRIETMPVAAKPIIYLYPTHETEVSVKLPLKEQITCSYPKYTDGWEVIAEPNGNLMDLMLGLTERESEEFIVYWLPKLEANKYNYIRFATLDEINENMPLEINPNPDTIIRVLMTYKGLEKPIAIQEQQLVTPERKGFVAVEWGGTEIK